MSCSCLCNSTVVTLCSAVCSDHGTDMLLPTGDAVHSRATATSKPVGTLRKNVLCPCSSHACRLWLLQRSWTPCQSTSAASARYCGSISSSWGSSSSSSRQGSSAPPHHQQGMMMVQRPWMALGWRQGQDQAEPVDRRTATSSQSDDDRNSASAAEGAAWRHCLQRICCWQQLRALPHSSAIHQPSAAVPCGTFAALCATTSSVRGWRTAFARTTACGMRCRVCMSWKLVKLLQQAACMTTILRLPCICSSSQCAVMRQRLGNHSSRTSAGLWCCSGAADLRPHHLFLHRTPSTPTCEGTESLKWVQVCARSRHTCALQAWLLASNGGRHLHVNADSSAWFWL